MPVLMILILMMQGLIIGPQPAQPIPELAAEHALELRAEGLERSSTFIDGGNACSDEERNTPANQEGYYYFCSDLDTYDEMYAYLEAAFTPDRAKELIESVVAEINGKLAYQSVGWGSMNDWARAEGKIASRDDQTVVYQFTVPMYGDEYPADEISVEYKYIADQGWRVNSPARSLR